MTDETYSLRKEKVLDAHASRKGCEKIFPYNKSTFKYIYNHLKSPLFSINYQFATAALSDTKQKKDGNRFFWHLLPRWRRQRSDDVKTPASLKVLGNLVKLIPKKKAKNPNVSSQDLQVTRGFVDQWSERDCAIWSPNKQSKSAFWQWAGRNTQSLYSSLYRQIKDRDVTAEMCGAVKSSVFILELLPCPCLSDWAACSKWLHYESASVLKLSVRQMF